MNKTVSIGVTCVIVAVIVGFFVGMQYEKSKSPTVGNGRFGQFQNRFGQNAQNVRPVRGQILSIDPTGMTVKMNDGTSRIVILSSSTSFVKSAPASKNDVAAGDKVMVIGTQNSDGSVTAQDVQINPPALRGSQPAPSGASR